MLYRRPKLPKPSGLLKRCCELFFCSCTVAFVFTSLPILQTSFGTLAKWICSASFFFCSFSLHSLILLFFSTLHLFCSPNLSSFSYINILLISSCALSYTASYSIPRLNQCSANNHISITLTTRRTISCARAWRSTTPRTGRPSQKICPPRATCSACIGAWR